MKRIFGTEFFGYGVPHSGLLTSVGTRAVHRIAKIILFLLWLLHVGNFRKVSRHQYYISSKKLPHPTQCRDLGITITSDLSPSNHIHHITAKAHQHANGILHCFVCGNI